MDSEHNFENLIKRYEQQFEQHGDSPASLLGPKGRNYLRYSVLDKYIQNDDISILDYGCGLGYLYKYIEEKKVSGIRYVGMDMVEKFIKFCSDNYKGNAKFEFVREDQKVPGQYDIVYASGVFHIVTDDRIQESKKYAFDKIKELFSATNQILICDFATDYVDYKQKGAQHFSIGEIADFCVNNLSRRFQIRHDVLPYEFTVLIYKDSEICRPENTYRVCI